MVVYGEYLFLENFVTGIMILHLTGKLSGLSLKKRNLILGGMSCGGYAFVLFVPLNIFFALLSKLLFSVAVIFMVFGQRDKKAYGKLVVLFYFISFAMGGITIGLTYFFGAGGISVNGAVYMGNIGYLLVCLTICAAYLFLMIIIDWMKVILRQRRSTQRVVVGMLGKETELLGLVDTGNFLTDPVTGKPVLLVCDTSLGTLVCEETGRIIRQIAKAEEAFLALENSEISGRITLVPYRAVGTKRGLLLGIRADYIQLRKEEGETKMQNVILGVYHGTFGEGFDGEPYRILIHPDMEERGLICHG